MSADATEQFSLFSENELNNLTKKSNILLPKKPTISKREAPLPIADSSAALNFEELLQSEDTVRLTSTPERLKSIEKVKKARVIKLEAKAPVKYVPNDVEDDEDAELFGKKPKKQQETMWEFLKNTGPEDLYGKSVSAPITPPKTKAPQTGRINGPLTVDSDDEDAELFGVKKREAKTESLADFLKNTAPPGFKPSDAPKPTTNPPKPIRIQPKMDEPLGTNSLDSLPLSNAKPNLEPRGAKTIETEDDEDDELFGKRPKRKEESLADFLRNTAPPPEANQVEPAIPKKKGGFAGLFSRKNVTDQTTRVSMSTPNLTTTPSVAENSRKYGVPNDPYASLKQATESNQSSSGIASISKSVNGSRDLPPVPIVPDVFKSSTPAEEKQHPIIEVKPQVVEPPKKKHPAPSTIVPEKFDETAPLKKVFKNLTKIDSQFLSVFEAKIDVVFPPEEGIPAERPKKVFTKPVPSDKVIIGPAVTSSVKRHTRTQTAIADVGECVEIQTDEIELPSQGSAKAPVTDGGCQTDATIEAENQILVVEVEEVEDYEDESNSKPEVVEVGTPVAVEMPVEKTDPITESSLDDNDNDIDELKAIEVDIEEVTVAELEEIKEPTVTEEPAAVSETEEQAKVEPEVQASTESVEPLAVKTEQQTVAESQESRSKTATQEIVAVIVAEILSKAIDMESTKSTWSQTPAQPQSFDAHTETPQASMHDSETQSDPVEFVTEQHAELSQVFDQVLGENDCLVDEVAKLRAMLNSERKKRQHIAEENAVLRYRYEKLARVTYSCLVKGLEARLELETELYNA